ncbi:MAG: methyl-accepting chemotaxis protein [Cellvibrio sp.]|uniref:methyl-accepting chemotaxis protein n=1 Tax=Cellvibrio sp. TaxID=1965322 RepID=UPI0031A4F635
MKISARLMLGATLLTGVAVFLAAGTTAWLALKESNRALSSNLEQQFQALAASRAHAVNAQFSNYQELLLSLAHGRMTQEAVYGFVRPFASYRYEVVPQPEDELRTGLKDWYQKNYLPQHQQKTNNEPLDTNAWVEKFTPEALLIQHYYLQNNPQPITQLELMDDASDATVYGQQHRRYHSSFRDLIKRFGFSDLLLVDAQSQTVIYSVQKSPLLGSSLSSGPFNNTPLAELAKQLQTAGENEVRFSSFHLNTTRFNQQMVYMGLPVFHDVQSPTKAVGYLIVEIPSQHLTDIVSANRHWQSLGLGDTGDVYLVDRQGVLLTELRPVLENSADFLAQLENKNAAAFTHVNRRHQVSGYFRPDTEAVSSALAGDTGSGITEDYFSKRVFSSWQPLQLGNQQLALVAQQDPDEVFAPLANLQGTLWRSLAIAMVLLTGAAAVIAYFFAQHIGKPLELLAAAIKKSAQDKNLASEFSDTRTDELGEIARSLNFLFRELNGVMVQVNKSSEQSLQGALENVTTTRQCRDETARQREEMNHVGAETETVVQSLAQMTERLHLVTEKISQASSVASEGKQRVNVVANQMHALAEQVTHSCSTLGELRSATDNIGSVLDTIQSVAEQTNLLALNAAIEAARAGEHGRGFAVVAEEVRRLSFDTQSATGKIKEMIDQLRSSVLQISTGLNAEQVSAQQCLLETQTTRASLDKIEQAVAEASAITGSINNSAQDESERALAMRSRLINLMVGINQTDVAISRLAEGAEQQNALANRVMSAAKVLRFSR